MCENLLIKLIINYILLINISANSNLEVLRQHRQFKTRCTRRYSPGACIGHVETVWTFVFQMKNCTARLGCDNYFRGNRFKSYNSCMRQCYGLVDMYMEMQKIDANDKKNNKLRKGQTTTPYFDNMYNSDEYTTQDEDHTENEEEYLEGHHDRGHERHQYVVYKDIINEEDIFPPDVDRVDIRRKRLLKTK